MRISGAIALVAVALTLAGPPADGGEIVRLAAPEIDDLQVVGFELDRHATVELEAIGILDDDVPRGLRWLVNIDRDDDDEPEMSVSAWLLDADTREAVWRMRADETYSIRGDVRGIDAELRLDPGRYELYLASSHGWARHLRDVSDDLDDRPWWQRLIPDNRRRLEDLKDDLADCHVTLSASGLDRSQVREFQPDGELAGALLAVNRLGDSALEVRGIVVDRATRLGVYGVIEHLRDDRDPSDFAWIVDESSREVVWHASDARSRVAGGSRKNRLIDDELELQPGRYVLYAGTDDSHSLEAFNAAPPHDPLNWGITLRAIEGTDIEAIRFFEPRPASDALVDFRESGDEAFREQPFRMERDGSLHVLAMGEYIDRDERFFDGAWIVDANGSTVWEMTGRNTLPAGGAEKNRMFDGLVELPSGDYVLYWSSDGSHSYEHWNAATPFDPAAWGVAIWPAGETRTADLRLLDEPARDERVLAAIVRVGDDARLEERFTLGDSTRIEVRALGEGTGGSMYDYGSIFDDDGRLVWRMQYDDTDHAGGADKNRMVVEQLTLRAGTYTVEYESDDSHSFPGWNARAPRDPLSWGITVRRVDR